MINLPAPNDLPTGKQDIKQEKPLQNPSFFEKNLKYSWLLIPLILILSLTAVYFSTNKKSTSLKTTQLLSPSISLPAPTITPSQNFFSQWNTYTNKKYGYTIQYPGNLYTNCTTEDDIFILFDGTGSCTAGEPSVGFTITVQDNKNNSEKGADDYKKSIDEKCYSVITQKTNIAGLPATKYYNNIHDYQSRKCNSIEISYSRSKVHFVIKRIDKIFTFEFNNFTYDDIKSQMLTTFKFFNQSQDNTTPSSWSIFTSPMQGFTLHIPENWIIEDNRSINCGYNTHGYNAGTPILIDNPTSHFEYCRDSFDFVSPDNIVAVRYVMYSDTTDDKQTCGTQSPCYPLIIQELEKLNIPPLGEIFMVKTGQAINLFKPADKSTIPAIGSNLYITDNSNPNHKVGYVPFLSLPTKTGGRYSLYISPPSFSLTDLTTEQFYNQQSVKQAILILKSLKY